MIFGKKKKMKTKKKDWENWDLLEWWGNIPPRNDDDQPISSLRTQREIPSIWGKSPIKEENR